MSPRIHSIFFFFSSFIALVFAQTENPCVVKEEEVKNLDCAKKGKNTLLTVYQAIDTYYKKRNTIDPQYGKLEIMKYGTISVDDRLTIDERIFSQRKKYTATLYNCAIKMTFKPLVTNSSKDTCSSPVEENKEAQDPTTLVITAGTHGDEYRTVDLVMSLIDEYFSKLEKGSLSEHLKKEISIYWIPVVHPYNYCRGVRQQKIDPNRSFHVSGHNEKRKKKTPEEITNLQDFYGKIQPVPYASIDYHDSHKNGFMLYPLANPRKVNQETRDKFAQEKEQFDDLSKKLVDKTAYKTGKVTEMGSYGIFKATGSSVDYFYETYGNYPLAIELPRIPVGHDYSENDFKDNKIIIFNLVSLVLENTTSCKNNTAPPKTMVKATSPR